MECKDKLALVCPFSSSPSSSSISSQNPLQSSPSFPSSSQSSPPSPPHVVLSPCAACKILRRRCVEKCVLAPYFPPTEPYKFTIAHRVFGASNIIKFLQVCTVFFNSFFHHVKPTFYFSVSSTKPIWKKKKKFSLFPFDIVVLFRL